MPPRTCGWAGRRRVGRCLPDGHRRARERADADVETGGGEGAELVTDGRGDAGPGGALLGPTILAAAGPTPSRPRGALRPGAGPVDAADLDEALEFVNSSRYGNAGSIFTTSGAAARAYRYGVEAGMLGVNVGVPAPVAWFPFSGWKDSSTATCTPTARTRSTSIRARRSSPHAGSSATLAGAGQAAQQRRYCASVGKGKASLEQTGSLNREDHIAAGSPLLDAVFHQIGPDPPAP